MSNPRLPRYLKLSRNLEPEEVSQAWQYLASLPEPSQWVPLPQNPPVPKNLRRLSDSDWHLLDSLLARELHLKSQASLH